MDARGRTARTTIPPRRLTARGAATRARIVAAAGDLVYDRGVRGTSLEDVMRASGTSKSQLYHYFADKDALVREVIGLQTSRVLAAQEPYLHHLDTLTGLRRWRDAVVAMNGARHGAGGCPVGSLASELADRSEDARVLLASSFRTWESHLVDGLTTMRDRDELAADVDPAALATAIMAALQGGLLLAQTTRTAEPLELALDMALGHVTAHVRPHRREDRSRR